MSDKPDSPAVPPTSAKPTDFAFPGASNSSLWSRKTREEYNKEIHDAYATASEQADPSVACTASGSVKAAAACNASDPRRRGPCPQCAGSTAAVARVRELTGYDPTPPQN